MLLLLRCKKVAGSHPAPRQVKGQFMCCLQVPPTVSGVGPAKEKVLSTSVVLVFPVSMEMEAEGLRFGTHIQRTGDSS